MKAYMVGLNSNPDVGNEIVFARNYKEAKNKAHRLELVDTKESYIDVFIKRYPVMDDMELSGEKEKMKVLWRNGWWFHQSGYPQANDDVSDKDFYEWYDKMYEKK